MGLPWFLQVTKKKKSDPGEDDSVTRGGEPGDYGQGGLFSGADPRNPAVMHYGDSPSGGVRQIARAAALDYSNSSGPKVAPPATRPRRALPRVTADPNAPIDAAPPALMAPPPEPRALKPYENVPAELVEVDAGEPVTGRPKARNLPAPGEQEANDAAVRDRLSQYPDAPRVGQELPPSADDSGATMTRARWSDPVNEETERNAALHEEAAHPRKMSRLKSVARMAVRGLMAGGPGGALAGAAIGAADPKLPNALDNSARAAQSDARLAQLRGQRRDDLATEQARAQIDWLRARSGIEQSKLPGAELQHARSLVLSNLRLLKGSRLDPANAQHAALIEEAQRLGIYVDPDSFNASRGNVVRYAKTDPEHPERTMMVERNVVTGEEHELGQKGISGDAQRRGHDLCGSPRRRRPRPFFLRARTPARHIERATARGPANLTGSLRPRPALARRPRIRTGA